MFSKLDLRLRLTCAVTVCDNRPKYRFVYIVRPNNIFIYHLPKYYIISSNFAVMVMILCVRPFEIRRLLYYRDIRFDKVVLGSFRLRRFPLALGTGYSVYRYIMYQSIPARRDPQKFHRTRPLTENVFYPFLSFQFLYLFFFFFCGRSTGGFE